MKTLLRVISVKKPNFTRLEEFYVFCGGKKYGSCVTFIYACFNFFLVLVRSISIMGRKICMLSHYVSSAELVENVDSLPIGHRPPLAHVSSVMGFVTFSGHSHDCRKFLMICLM